MNFELRFPKKEIQSWALRYEVKDQDALNIGIQARSRGYFTRPEFLALAYWKSPRSKTYCERNSESFIREVTHTALNASDEQMRIQVLILLEGVAWPIASTFLHFAHSDRYPILDFRALWSLKADAAKMIYDIKTWQEYTNFCRQLADDTNVSMRILDRALWQYSKVNQPSNSPE